VEDFFIDLKRYLGLFFGGSSKFYFVFFNFCFFGIGISFDFLWSFEIDLTLGKTADKLHLL